MAENNQKKQNPAPEQDTNSLRQIRIDKLHAMQEAGNDPFQVMTANQTAESMEIKNNYEDFEDKEVSICGRMIARRIMGKASFAQIQDREGNIQIYVSRDDLGVDDYQAFKKAWDIGDILEVTGKVFKTKTGEISVHATHAKLLSKSLLPLPEKFHGLKDADTRYRPRRWMTRVTSKSRLRSSTPSPAARLPVRSSPTTTRWTSTCTCASPPSCL